MGCIIESWPAAKGALRMSVAVDKAEAVALGGNFSDVLLFSADACVHPSEVVSIGADGATKYFRMPSSLARKGKCVQASVPARCLRLDAGDKVFIIYIVDKNVSAQAPAQDRRSSSASALGLLRGVHCLFGH